MPVRIEVLPYLDIVAIAALSLLLLMRVARISLRKSAWTATVFALIAGIGMCLFFRDPERVVPADPSLIVSGADGIVDAVEMFNETEYLGVEAVRITVFLNLHNVHVNRSPIAGDVHAMDFRSGKKMAAYLDEASELNQCNTILIEGDATRCVVRQLVGAVVRRVVSWVDVGQPLARGERLGMMKFGSRLDVILPRDDVDVLVQVGDRVVAGESSIARLREE